MKKIKIFLQYCLIISSALFCTSCATTVGITAATLTSATISVGAAIITAPFKLIGVMDDDEEDEENEEAN